jgi:hypothetical protein
MKQKNVMTSRRKFTTVSKLVDCPWLISYHI